VTVVRVLLIDGNAAFLDGLSAWLIREPGIDIVGVAHSGQDGLDRITDLRPDLVLLDVTSTRLNAFEATRTIKSDPTAPRVVLMTFHDNEALRQEAWAAGADGIVAKAQITEDLLELVRELFSGRAGSSGTARGRIRPGKPRPPGDP